MTAFSVTPLTDVPPPAAQEFPNFIQMQAAGTDLGGPDADVLNFGAGLTATRGTGENSNVVSVTGEGLTLQMQEDGVDLGLPNVRTLNFGPGIQATRGTDDTVTVSVETPPSTSITWRAVSSSTDIALEDLGNGIDASSELDGTITITIPAEDPEAPFTNDPVLIFMGGTRLVQIDAAVGVLLLVRSAFSTALAGQYATATLLRRESDVWILCGDLEAA